MISLAAPRTIQSLSPAREFAARLAKFTLAGREVARQLSRGLLNNEVADVQGKAEPAVKQQARSLFAKTDFSNRGRPIAWLRTGTWPS